MVTIPASGSEASNSCVISNDEEYLKCSINTDLNRPAIAFLDPELTFSLPARQTAAGVTDMIAHIMERLFSGEPAVGVTDNIACGLVRAAREAAPKVMENPDDYDARAEIMWVGTLAHNALRDGDWTCRGLEHELSALDTKITHGAGLAVIFPAWMRYVWREHPERFLEFSAQALGIEPIDSDADELDVEVTPEQAIEYAVEATIDELQDFFVSLGMPRAIGVRSHRGRYRKDDSGPQDQPRRALRQLQEAHAGQREKDLPQRTLGNRCQSPTGEQHGGPRKPETAPLPRRRHIPWCPRADSKTPPRGNWWRGCRRSESGL